MSGAVTEKWSDRFTWASLTRKKPVEKSLSEETTTRTLTWVDLTLYGISATVGSGVYTVVGQVAQGGNPVKVGGVSYFTSPTGPAAILSTLIAGALSLLTSICYLEFASALPISGSGYAYFYSMIGEFLGWFIGWNLTLEYAFAAAAIAGKWSGILKKLLIHLDMLPAGVQWVFGWSFTEDKLFRLDLVAPLLIVLMGAVVSRGVSMGARFTNVATIMNLSLIVFIVVVGSCYVSYANWTPFFAPVDAVVPTPPSLSARIFSGGAEMFFCYIGYDTVSTLSADAVNPARDIPIAAFLTIGTATLLYGLVGLVLTGMQRYTQFEREAPLAGAFRAVNLPIVANVVSILSLLNMSVTVFACLLGQPKIIAAISRDGLLPRGLARENRRGVPSRSVFATVALTAAVAAVFDVNEGLIDMIAAGCLFSMSIVCAGMLAARFNHAPASLRGQGHVCTTVFFVASLATCLSFVKDGGLVLTVGCGLVSLAALIHLTWLFMLHSAQLRPVTSGSLNAFVCPLMPLIPCIAMLANNYVFASIKMEQIKLFIWWAVIGVAIYFTYSLHHSKLGRELEAVRSFGKF